VRAQRQARGETADHQVGDDDHQQQADRDGGELADAELDGADGHLGPGDDPAGRRRAERAQQHGTERQRATRDGRSLRGTGWRAARRFDRARPDSFAARPRQVRPRVEAKPAASRTIGK